jgi:hypothetical protein
VTVTTELDAAERRELRRKARESTLNALEVLGGEARRNAIGDRALADGGFTPRELAAAAPEKAADKYERLIDYELSWTLTHLKRDGLVENPRWGVWRLVGAALEQPGPAVDDVVSDDRLAELRAMPYRDYLRTPEWRRTRAAAIIRADNACSLDVTHGAELDVHHRTYARLGEELEADLAVLCRSCHQVHHKAYGRPRREQPNTTQREALLSRTAAQPSRKRSLLRRLLTG